MNKIEVVVDKRTELIAILLLISDNYREKYPYLTTININKDYYKKIQKFSSKIKNHQVVKLIDYLTENLSFGYNAPFDLINQLSKDLKSVQLNEEWGTCSRRLNGDPLLLEFLNLIPDFAKEYFNKFYNDNLGFYNKYINLAENHISKIADIPEYINKFYGADNTNKTYLYNLVFANGDGGGFGYEINNEVWCTHLLGFENNQCHFNGGAFFLHEFRSSYYKPAYKEIL